MAAGRFRSAAICVIRHSRMVLPMEEQLTLDFDDVARRSTETWNSFCTLMTVSTVAVAALLALMAVFLL
jgi:hypothetical protein